MTRSTLQRTLRLLPSGHWAPSPRPLNLALRHPRTPPRQPPPPPPPPPSTQPEHRAAFDTLASDATAAPSLQGVPDPLDGTADGDGGTRTATPLDSAQPVQDGQGLARSVLGVELPTKPKPPEPDECCMSGCATCVYDLYLEDVEHFHAEALERRARVLDVLRRAREGEGEGEGEGEDEVGGTSEREPSGWRDAVDVLGPWSDAVRDLAAASRSSSAGSAGAGAGVGEQGEAARADEARDRAERELKRARDALDPGMRAFLEMEARIKAKQRDQAAAPRAHPASPAPGSSSLSSNPPPT
ncbi:hypothetical protein JCM8208_001726 [Rhodotorula glutinis]